MKFRKLRKIIASTTVIATLLSNCSVYAATTNSSSTATSTANSVEEKSNSSSNENVLSVNVDDNGSVDYTVPVSSEDRENQQFSWDNASVYFVMTDRFYNGDKSNDHSYGRSKDEKNAADYENRQGTFHGGDLKGLTEKLNEGYFDKLGINAMWITAPYEQIHGAVESTGFKHYSYEGYWTLDYTQVDENMGTADDLRTFIDTAHSHGIRVVFDVVMNHAGYADPVTCNDYNVGGLISNWKDIYYNWDESKYQWYNDYDGKAAENGHSGEGMMKYDADWVSTWWSPDWVRAITDRFKGYQGSEDGDDLTKCLNGLPDFKIEDTSKEVSLPPILVTKWKQEGRYDTEVKELNDWFTKTGRNKCVQNYLIKWLTDWVREYGVDGFRCDTAKHIPLNSWKELKVEANKALQEWRSKNKGVRPGAEWTDDFWMTAENNPTNVGGSKNYFDNGFDSVINFDFKDKNHTLAFTNYGGLENKYSSYANIINNDSKVNYLTYISSHDVGLSRGGDMKLAGTNLLLTPGGIQIFYGDETDRQTVGNDKEMSWRSQMNWNSINNDVLTHWQKVGTFRNDNIAVGAGTHAKLNDSPYTFSRIYSKGTVNNSVVCCLPGKAGTYEVKVGDAFVDGQSVKDAYSGTKYVVSGNKVSVTCDSNGVILLQKDGEDPASVSATPGTKNETYSYENTIEITLGATKKATDTKYSLNGAAAKSFTNGQTITIGQGLANGDLTTLKVTGKDENGKDLVSNYTFKKVVVPYNKGYLYAQGLSGWGTDLYAYIYDESTGTAKSVAPWPGTKMTFNTEYNRYELEIPAEFQKDTTQVIFTDRSKQVPGSQQPGAYYKTGMAMLFDGSEIKLVDTTDKLTAGAISTDKAAPQYAGTAIKITTNEATNGSGNYAYKFVVVDENNNEKVIKDYSDSKTATWTPSVKGNYTIKVYSKDTTDDKEVVATKSFAIDPVQGPQVNFVKFSIKSGAQVGDSIKISTGATGTGVKYKYIILDSNSKIAYSTGYSKRAYTTWVPNAAGKYSVNVKVKDVNGVEGIKTVDYEVKEAPSACKLTSVTTSKTSPQVAGTQIKVSAVAEASTAVSYKFWIHELDGDWTLFKNYSAKSTILWTPTKAGTYVIWVDAKDEKGNRDFKAVTYIVK